MASGRIIPPVQQHQVEIDGHRYRLDFAWPDRRIFLEGQGFGFHSMASDLDSDARRQNTLVADGWLPIELTWRMPEDEILGVLRAMGLPEDQSGQVLRLSSGWDTTTDDWLDLAKAIAAVSAGLSGPTGRPSSPTAAWDL